MKSKFVASVSESLLLESLKDSKTGEMKSPEFIRKKGLGEKFLDAIDMIEKLNQKLDGKANHCYTYKRRSGYTVYIYD